MRLDVKRGIKDIFFEDRQKLVIKDITDSAWAYILSERKKLVDPEHQHWYFSRENYDGVVYLTVTESEDKSEIVPMLDKLIGEYGLIVSQSAIPIIDAWRKDAGQTRQNMESNTKQWELEDRLRNMKRIIRDGCEGCPEFRTKRRGMEETDVDGYCVADGMERLDKITSWKYGKTHHGTVYNGNKFIPCEKCKYLKEEV